MADSCWHGLIIAQLAAITVAIPSLLLCSLVVCSFGALHTNCRVLLLTWIFACFVIVVENLLVLLYRIIVIEDCFPRSPSNPSGLRGFYFAHEFGYALSSVTECFIVLERLLASRMLARYKETFCSSMLLASAVFIAIAASVGYGYAFHFRGFSIQCLVTGNCFDLTIIVLNVVSDWSSRRRYAAMFARATLNARYQMSEVVHLSRVLLPICILSMLLKATGNASGYLSFLNIWSGSYFVVQAFYYFLVTTNCIICVWFLMLRHSGFHGRLLVYHRRILRLFLGSHHPNAASPKHYRPAAPPAIGFREHHFDMLRQSWK